MVYCEGDTLYTGVAQDICRRMRQHTDRGTACARYTRAHPVQALAALWEAEDKGSGPAAGIPHQAADPDGEGTPHP
ncbi:MAG: hypothetical protein V8S77_05060 [Oscillospiraceae bacterium]